MVNGDSWLWLRNNNKNKYIELPKIALGEVKYTADYI